MLILLTSALWPRASTELYISASVFWTAGGGGGDEAAHSSAQGLTRMKRLAVRGGVAASRQTPSCPQSLDGMPCPGPCL